MVTLVLLRRNNSSCNNNGGYTKMEKEDPEEKTHREAQFLIYKTMKQVDQIVMKKKSCKPSWLRLRIRICKLKVKIGNKLLRLRKTMLCNHKAKVGVCKQLIMGQINTFKGLFNGGRGGGGSQHGGGGGRGIRHLPRPLMI